MLDELLNHVKSTSEENRIVVIRSSGSVFSAGHDLKELVDSDIQGKAAVFEKCEALMKAIRLAPVPVLAAIDGLATAAGCQIVATCDLAVATRNSKFATPGVKVGLFCSTPGVPLARSVPRKVAADMLFTGQPITAEEALRSGLVSRVVRKEALDDCINEIVSDVCGVDRSVISLGKKAFYEQINLPEDEALSKSSCVMLTNLEYNAAQDGIAKFLKRK
ncbi:unnamed protein product [Dimorphilus gyrociliatus]|uniref:Enoyl-CoA hydratase domain-containing protein 3, mitochondrial n=1 Tax=Dimorphilus gyrociliatus TaxID=2664684 RepID=A0A7I8W3N9_9ANNE|nr:unnamed protein product [Dimorphilus gyrociliatus]